MIRRVRALPAEHQGCSFFIEQPLSLINLKNRTTIHQMRQTYPLFNNYTRRGDAFRVNLIHGLSYFSTSCFICIQQIHTVLSSMIAKWQTNVVWYFVVSKNLGSKKLES